MGKKIITDKVFEQGIEVLVNEAFSKKNEEYPPKYPKEVTENKEDESD